MFYTYHMETKTTEMRGIDNDTVAKPTTGLEQLRREMTRGTAELAVLAVVYAKRRYGYEILKLLQGEGEHGLEIKEGTLYPLLHRLEDVGYIAGEWEAEGRSRPRKYYSLTASGRAHLALLRTEWSALIQAMQALLSQFDEVDQ
jgi:PadR family transcriptional regulator, regulatory protein PadR